MRFLLSLALLFVLATSSFAQEAVKSQTTTLTIEQIMQEPGSWIGDWPQNLRWHESGTRVYFDWNPGGDFPSDSLFVYDLRSDGPRKVTAEERRSGIAFFEGWQHGSRVYTADFQKKVFASDGDLFLYDREADRTQRLTHTRAEEGAPRFTPDGSQVVYVRDGNLFTLEMSTGLTRQLTDLREGEAEEPDTTAQEQFLFEQQTTLFETLREQKEERDQAEAAEERDRKALGVPSPFHYGDGTLDQLQLDPTGRFATFAVREESPQADETLVADYVTLSGFADGLDARPKVGIQPDDFTLHVHDLQRDTTYAVDLHQLPGAYDVPEYRAEQGVELDSSEAKRALYAYGPYWNRSGSHGVVVVRADDNKDRWIARLDAATGELTLLDRQHDDAWIGGPGVGSYGGAGTVGWVPEGDGEMTRFFFQSEATGYSHLYTVDARTGDVEALTSGSFEVRQPRLSRDGTTWTFHSNEPSPHEQHLYRMSVQGGDRTRLTEESGFYTAPPSPIDQLAYLYEYTNRPPEVYLQPRRAGADSERITESPSDDWLAYDWRDPQVVEFEASDGVDVPAHLYRPDDPNGAAVLFVHGAGYLQNVRKAWSYYYRETMFHNMLVDLGYTVIDVDYRGSAGYGRDWRTAIYRHMGGRDLQDYVDAQAYLADEFGISADRSFIYGGSYGGFMTLMALFTAPDSFAGGAALRSVTDWAHYNDVYTSNILNTPATDSIAYARSSPIYFAEGLDDPLVMPHGLIDTNVQPQDIFRLSQRLIELGKTDWELAIYPVEGHGFTEPSSWTDEYRRIFELIQKTVGPDRQK